MSKWEDLHPVTRELGLARDRIKESRHEYQVETEYANQRYLTAVSAYYDLLLERSSHSVHEYYATPEELEKLEALNRELRPIVADLWLDAEADRGYGASSPFQHVGGRKEAVERKARINREISRMFTLWHSRKEQGPRSLGYDGVGNFGIDKAIRRYRDLATGERRVIVSPAAVFTRRK